MVSWQPPKDVNGLLQGYTINYRSQSKNVGPALNAKVGPSETSFIIESEFKPDMVYDFWVKARNGKHESSSSNMVQLKFDGTSNIEQISKIAVTNITKKSVTLEWKSVANADGYMIEPMLPQSYPQLSKLWVKNSTVTLDNMVPGTQYVIRVAAYVKQYVGRHETTIVKFGGEPLPAINLRLKEQTQEYSLLEWDEPHGSYGKLTYGIYYGTNMDQLFEGMSTNEFGRFFILRMNLFFSLQDQHDRHKLQADEAASLRILPRQYRHRRSDRARPTRPKPAEARHALQQHIATKGTYR